LLSWLVSVTMRFEVNTMDMNRRKQLLETYKNRHPEMGVISFRCKATGEAFLGISKDTRADFNSTRVKLAANYYPNRRLLDLWNQNGEEGFECSVLKVLDYEDPRENHTDALEALREKCFLADPQAKKLWK